MTAPLRAHEIQVNGVRSPVLEGGRSDSPEAVVFVHGNPGSSRDWQSLAAAVAAFARAVALDMPGFGALGAPRFRRTLGARLGGAASDEFASATLINTGVLLGYRWHVLARIWRTPVLGELFQATATRATFRLVFFVGAARWYFKSCEPTVWWIIWVVSLWAVNCSARLDSSHTPALRP